MSVGYIPLLALYILNASNMPFDEVTAYAGGGIVKLDDPGKQIWSEFALR